MYIRAASTISYQPTFRNPGFSSALRNINPTSSLITPDYSEFIPIMERRRMSDVQKLSISCSVDCLQLAGMHQPDAIIVGTSMGCSINTKNFLDKILEAGDGPLSPTSFIVSTHNTIAGQIALRLKNHGYNMTHTQNSLSFEQALLDAKLCIGEGRKIVLVGGADEEENAIYNMKARLNNHSVHLACGVSFFILFAGKTGDSVRIIDVGSFGLVDNKLDLVKNFLWENKISSDEIDLVLFAASDEKNNVLPFIFSANKLFNYQKVTGTYYTSSAFAMHIAVDIISSKCSQPFGEVTTVLVYNNLIPENLGLILLTGN